MRKVKFFTISLLSFAIFSNILFLLLFTLTIPVLRLVLGLSTTESLELASLLFFGVGLIAGVIGWVGGIVIGFLVSTKFSRRFNLKWYWGLITLAVYLILFAVTLLLLPGARPVRAEVIENPIINHNQLTFGTWSTFSSSTSPNSDPATLVDLKKQVIHEIAIALQNQDPVSLYDLMAGDFKGVFTEENLASSLLGGEKIVNITYLDAPQTLPAGYSEQRATFKTESGIEKTFNLILKLEDSKWKLAATEEVVK